MKQVRTIAGVVLILVGLFLVVNAYLFTALTLPHDRGWAGVPGTFGDMVQKATWPSGIGVVMIVAGGALAASSRDLRARLPEGSSIRFPAFRLSAPKIVFQRP